MVMMVGELAEKYQRLFNSLFERHYNETHNVHVNRSNGSLHGRRTSRSESNGLGIRHIRSPLITHTP